jgi:hypothetical protein
MQRAGARVSDAQSELLQHCPGGTEHIVASGTFVAQTR